MDPNAVMHLLHQHNPYHVASLLVMFGAYRCGSLGSAAPCSCLSSLPCAHVDHGQLTGGSLAAVAGRCRGRPAACCGALHAPRTLPAVVRRSTGQHEAADDMLQRAVYALELGFHPSLHLRGLDLCLVDEFGFQVDSSKPENEPLFQALFWHAQVGPSLPGRLWQAGGGSWLPGLRQAGILLPALFRHAQRW